MIDNETLTRIHNKWCYPEPPKLDEDDPRNDYHAWRENLEDIDRHDKEVGRE